MILITGATGKIGRELIPELKAKRSAFKVMVRAKAVATECEAQDIPAVLGDFERPDSYEGALSGVQTVFLLTTPQPDIQALERHFLAACKAKGVHRVVRLSAMGANPWCSSALARCHGKCEAQLEESGLEWTILRPAIFMQNLVPTVGPSVAKESTIYAPAGEARLPWVDTRDVAAVAGTVLTTHGHQERIYEITGPELLTYNHVAQILSAQLGRQISFVNVPDGAAHQAMVSTGMSPWLAEGMITLFHLLKANGTTALTLDTVERLTLHPPRTLAAYLKEHLAAFRSSRPVAVTGH